MPTLRTFSYALKEAAFARGIHTLRGSRDIVAAASVNVEHEGQLLMD